MENKDNEKNDRRFLERMNQIRYVHLAQLIVLAAIMALIVLNFNNILSTIGRVLGVLRPVTLGLIMAYIINLPMVAIEKRYFPGVKSRFVLKSRRIVSILLSLFIILGVITLMVWLVIPQVSNAFNVVVDKFPSLYQSTVESIKSNMDKRPFLAQRFVQISNNLEGMISKLMENGGILANGIFNVTISAIGGLIDFVLGLMFSIYMLLTKEKLLEQVGKVSKAYFSVIRREKIGRVLNVANRTFSGYITGQMVESLVIGVLFTIVLIIFRFPYATMIGTITGITTLIPILGAMASGALGFLMIFTVDPVKAMFFLLFIYILQQVDGNFIYPRIVGEAVGMPPLWVLMSITIGGGMFGIVGTLLAVPTMATIYKLLKIDVNQKLKEKDKIKPNSLVALKVQKSLNTEEKMEEEIKEEQIRINNDNFDEIIDENNKK